MAAGGTDIPRSTAAAARLAAQLQALLEPDNTWAAPGKPVTTDPVVLPADAAGRESSGVVQGGVARVEAGADAPGATSYRPRAGGFAASEHHAFTPVGGASALAAQVFEVPKSTQGERRPGEVSSPPPPSAVDRGLSGEGWLAGPPQSIAAVRAQIDGAMASTTAPLASIADEHGVVPQVVKAIHLQWRQGLGEARLRLDPPHLGEIHVSLRVQEGVVSAFVRAENPTVQTWIDMRQQDLRNALEEQGLRLERFEVVVDPDGGRRDSNDQQSPAPRPRTPRGRPGAPRFEVNA